MRGLGFSQSSLRKAYLSIAIGFGAWKATEAEASNAATNARSNRDLFQQLFDISDFQANQAKSEFRLAPPPPPPPLPTSTSLRTRSPKSPGTTAKAAPRVLISAPSSALLRILEDIELPFLSGPKGRPRSRPSPLFPSSLVVDGEGAAIEDNTAAGGEGGSEGAGKGGGEGGGGGDDNIAIVALESLTQFFSPLFDVLQDDAAVSGGDKRGGRDLDSPHFVLPRKSGIRPNSPIIY